MQLSKCIAIYIRLSMEDGNVDGEKKTESNSVSAQRRLLRDFIAKQEEFRNISAVEYVDDGFSGTNFNRPSFQRMMVDARGGRLGTIIVKDFSRFGRDDLEVGNYLEKIFPLLGVRFISVNDGFDSNNYSGVTGGISIALKNMLNAMYSRDLSKKVRSALATHVKKGEYVTAFTPYGYLKDPGNKHQLIVDPEAAEVVKLVFTMAAEGKTKNQIARYLNENNVMTCREHMRQKGVRLRGTNEKEKKLWTVSTIADMLKKQVYLGCIVFHKTERTKAGGRNYRKIPEEDWIIVKGTHEPIVSEELFLRANECAFKHVKKPNVKHSDIKEIFCCPSCGRRMRFSSNGTHYRCNHSSYTGLAGCQISTMERQKAEMTVLSAARNMAQFISWDLEKRKKEWQNTSLTEEKIAALEGEKKRLTSRKMKLYADYRTDQMTRQRYMEELEKTSSRLLEIDETISKLEEEILNTRRIVEEADQMLAKANDIAVLNKYDKSILSKVIERVNIYDKENLEIVWKMDDIFAGLDFEQAENFRTE